jgi:hypothetical protein
MIDREMLAQIAQLVAAYNSDSVVGLQAKLVVDLNHGPTLRFDFVEDGEVIGRMGVALKVLDEMTFERLRAGLRETINATIKMRAQKETAPPGEGARLSFTSCRR